jgi:hypothetical protein
MAKLNRESRLRERRLEKKARKVARKLAASEPDQLGDTLTGAPTDSEDYVPVVDSPDYVPAAGS